MTSSGSPGTGVWLRILAGIALAHGVGSVATLGWHLAMSRSLGAAGYGRLAFGMAVVLVLTHLTAVGLRQALVRHVPGLLAGPGAAALPSLLRRAVAVPALVGAALLAIGWLLAGPGGSPLGGWLDGRDLALLTCAGAGAGLTGIWAGHLQAVGAARRGAFVGSGLLPLALLAGFALALAAGRSSTTELFTVVAIVSVGAGLAGAASLLTAARSQSVGASIGPSVSAPSAGQLLSFGWKSMVVGLVYLGMAVLDRLMLGALGTFEDVGVYSLPATLASALTFVVYVFPPLVGPIYSRWLSGPDEGRALEAYRVTAQVTALASAPLALLLAFHGREILEVLGGAEYAGGAAVLALLAAAQLAVAATGNNGLMLLMGGHERAELTACSLTLGLNVVLNAWLIPRHGALGAAAATLASLLLSTLVKTALVRARWRTWPFGRGTARVVAGAGVFVALQLAPDLGLGWVGRAGAGLLAYVIVAAPWRDVPRLARVVAARGSAGLGAAEPAPAGGAGP